MECLNFKDFSWLNKPKKFELSNDYLIIETEPGTDFWQQTYYGFRNDNAPGFLAKSDRDFTFRVKIQFNSSFKYDQCGILLYCDSKNWAKISVEYENEEFARLGSVVTNLGYSDWASTDIPATFTKMWFRLSRRGQDFLAESSNNGIDYKQMRIFHMHIPLETMLVGVYACSPLQSGFKATFTEFKLGPCEWAEHD